MKPYILLFFLLLCWQQVFSQKVKLREGEYIKVEARIDERVRPYKYMYTVPTSEGRIEPDRLIPMDSLLRYYFHPSVVKRYLDAYSDSVDIQDSITIFFVWEKEGMFKVVTKKKLNDNSQKFKVSL